jgi:hypothetical protein
MLFMLITAQLCAKRHSQNCPLCHRESAHPEGNGEACSGRGVLRSRHRPRR